MGLFSSVKGWFGGTTTGNIQAVAASSQSATVMSHSINSYCVKCRTKTDMLNPVKTILKNNRKALRGICSVCGTSMFRIGG